MNSPSMENLMSTGSYQEELYASALGWKTPELFILNRAIVISVKVGVDVSPQGSANLPQFSINARIIGEDLSNVSPENEVTRWYAPLMSNTIISVPEVGEQVFVMRETTLNKSKELNKNLHTIYFDYHHNHYFFIHIFKIFLKN